MRSPQRAPWVAVLLLYAAGISIATAGEPVTNPSLTKTWVFDAGAVFQNLDGGATSELVGGGGGSVNFSQIGLDDQNTSPFLAVRWRFADNWRFDFTYDSVDVNGGHGNRSTIEFGRITIPVGYQIDSSLDTRNYSAFVGYSFVKDSQSELGVRLGVSVMDAEASLEGSVWIGGALQTTGTQNASVVGPIPTIGLYGTYALTNQWTIDGSIDGLAFNVGDYSGHYLAATATFTYWLSDIFAVGLGYRYIDSKLEHEGDVFDDVIEFRYSGPVVKASVGF